MAQAVLPVVHHLVHQGGQHLLHRAHGEVTGVQAQLVQCLPLPVYEPVFVVVAIGPLGRAQGDEAGPELATEQGLVEVVEGALEFAVEVCGRAAVAGLAGCVHGRWLVSA